MDEFVLSVHELNTYVADKLSGDPLLEEAWIKGEVTDVSRRHETIYFVLKDELSAIDAMLFCSGEAAERADLLEEGQRILARGEVSVYWKNGKYRLLVRELESAGAGELYARFLKMKEALQKKGIFDEKHKKPIPQFPAKIGIVTSQQGAAIQDICNIVQRRNPYVKLMLYPVRVQGADAPAQIARGVAYFNRNTDVDVLIVGRGGGSAEDLFAFNEEEVVMAVYESRIPVISAVGHETDYSLTDLAADMRAPTPSAAAELAVPERNEIVSQLVLMREHMERRICRLFADRKSEVQQQRQYLGREALLYRAHSLRDRLGMYKMQADISIKHLYKKLSMQYNSYRKSIDDLSPLSAFERGYSVAMVDGRELKSVSQVKDGDTVKILLQDGAVLTEVKGKEEA